MRVRTRPDEPFDWIWFYMKTLGGWFDIITILFAIIMTFLVILIAWLIFA